MKKNKGAEMHKLLLLFFMSFTLPCFAQMFDFFKIQAVKYVDSQPTKGIDIFDPKKKLDSNNRSGFSPYLEVTLSVGERTRSKTVYTKIYYYNKDRVLIDKTESSSKPESMPVFLEKNKSVKLYFIVPKKALATSDWRGVVVFGDKLAATAVVYPSGMQKVYDFPERNKVDQPSRVPREVVSDPVVEHVVKTGNAKQPQLTLFMRPPIGMADMSEADGVLAMCLLANSVEEVKIRLQKADSTDDVGGILRFAEKRKLVILCWGSRSLWDPRKNWDELDKGSVKQMDDTFDDVAAAWARGVENLAHRYGIPDKEFLLWGVSGAAQYAQRLALRKPQYFLAVHAHIPSSFDKPTTDAAQVLWCLTTGENESGYERSLRFLAECRGMGYPIIYKAIPGLGHQGHPVADRLGTVFFDYALSLREEKRNYEESMAKGKLSGLGTQKIRHSLPWPVSFREPEVVGDVVNQQVFPADEAARCVPAAFRIDIPTKALADAWKMEK
jgi:hypothetical protein